MKKNNPDDPISPDSGLAPSTPIVRPIGEPVMPIPGDGLMPEPQPSTPIERNPISDESIEEGEAAGAERAASPVLRRIEATQPGKFPAIKARLSDQFHVILPVWTQRIKPYLARAVGFSRRCFQTLFVAPFRKKAKTKRKRKDTIRQTDRERVYKLRGFTTVESVIAKRKAQRRFRIAQRITITLMCVGLLGYIAFRNNPFTDYDEWMRMIGIHKTKTLDFHQYAFPLVEVYPEPGTEIEGIEDSETDENLIETEVRTPSEWTAENDWVQRIIENGREDERFYILAYPGIGALKSELDTCIRTLSASDYARLAATKNLGTVLVILPKDGDPNTYRFTSITQSGAIIDVAAIPVEHTGGGSVIYIIGFQNSQALHGYSFDIEVDPST